jgi:SNF2 family DNA or RNA helicase
VLVGKLQQITSGFYTNTRYKVDLEGREENISNIIYFENNSKIDLLVEAMKQIPEDKKTIIWSYRIPAIKLITSIVEKKFGEKSYLTCFGNQDSFEMVNLFRSGKERWIVANPMKMGTGQNIQFSSYQIFYDNSFSLIQKEQAEARQHRQGQMDKVTVIELIARRTVDERIARVIIDKKDLSLTLSQWAQVFRRG